MREYQTWTRAEIHARVRELDQRKQALQEQLRKVETMHIDVSDMRGKVDIDDKKMKETIVSLRRSTLSLSLYDEQIKCSEEQRALNIEIHIRDDPKLVAELGPGRD